MRRTQPRLPAGIHNPKISTRPRLALRRDILDVVVLLRPQGPSQPRAMLSVVCLHRYLPNGKVRLRGRDGLAREHWHSVDCQRSEV